MILGVESSMSDTHIDSEEALAEFRSTLFSAGSLAPIIDANPATLINAPIGIRQVLADRRPDRLLPRRGGLQTDCRSGRPHGQPARAPPHPPPGPWRGAASPPAVRQTVARSTHPGASTSSGGLRPGPNATSARTASTIGGASGRRNTAPACVTPGSCSEPTSISSTIAGSYRISG